MVEKQQRFQNLVHRFLKRSLGVPEKCAQFRSLGGWGRGSKSVNQKVSCFATKFHLKSSNLRNEGYEGGKGIHFLKALFMTYPKIIVWWLLLSG